MHDNMKVNQYVFVFHKTLGISGLAKEYSILK